MAAKLKRAALILLLRDNAPLIFEKLCKDSSNRYNWELLRSTEMLLRFTKDS